MSQSHWIENCTGLSGWFLFQRKLPLSSLIINCLTETVHEMFPFGLILWLCFTLPTEKTNFSHGELYNHNHRSQSRLSLWGTAENPHQDCLFLSSTHQQFTCPLFDILLKERTALPCRWHLFIINLRIIIKPYRVLWMYSDWCTYFLQLTLKCGHQALMTKIRIQWGRTFYSLSVNFTENLTITLPQATFSALSCVK